MALPPVWKTQTKHYRNVEKAPRANNPSWEAGFLAVEEGQVGRLRRSEFGAGQNPVPGAAVAGAEPDPWFHERRGGCRFSLNQPTETLRPSDRLT